MINLIPGKKGTGKTKILVDSIKKAAENATGNVVCIERGMQLTYEDWLTLKNTVSTALTASMALLQV